MQIAKSQNLPNFERYNFGNTSSESAKLCKQNHMYVYTMRAKYGRQCSLYTARARDQKSGFVQNVATLRTRSATTRAG